MKLVTSFVFLLLIVFVNPTLQTRWKEPRNLNNGQVQIVLIPFLSTGIPDGKPIGQNNYQLKGESQDRNSNRPESLNPNTVEYKPINSLGVNNYATIELITFDKSVQNVNAQQFENGGNEKGNTDNGNNYNKVNRQGTQIANPNNQGIQTDYVLRVGNGGYKNNNGDVRDAGNYDGRNIRPNGNQPVPQTNYESNTRNINYDGRDTRQNGYKNDYRDAKEAQGYDGPVVQTENNEEDRRGVVSNYERNYRPVVQIENGRRNPGRNYDDLSSKETSSTNNDNPPKQEDVYNFPLGRVRNVNDNSGRGRSYGAFPERPPISEGYNRIPNKIPVSLGYSRFSTGTNNYKAGDQTDNSDQTNGNRETAGRVNEYSIIHDRRPSDNYKDNLRVQETTYDDDDGQGTVTEAYEDDIDSSEEPQSDSREEKGNYKKFKGKIISGGNAGWKGIDGSRVNTEESAGGVSGSNSYPVKTDTYRPESRGITRKGVVTASYRSVPNRYRGFIPEDGAVRETPVKIIENTRDHVFIRSKDLRKNYKNDSGEYSQSARELPNVNRGKIQDGSSSEGSINFNIAPPTGSNRNSENSKVERLIPIIIIERSRNVKTSSKDRY